MGRMKDLFMAEQERLMLDGHIPAQDTSYKLYIAETALRRIAGGDPAPGSVAAAALAQIDDGGLAHQNTPAECP